MRRRRSASGTRIRPNGTIPREMPMIVMRGTTPATRSWVAIGRPAMSGHGMLPMKRISLMPSSRGPPCAGATGSLMSGGGSGPATAEDVVRYREVPGTGIRVSEIGFGAEPLASGWWGDTGDDEAIRLLHAALGLSLIHI